MKARFLYFMFATCIFAGCKHEVSSIPIYNVDINKSDAIENFLYEGPHPVRLDNSILIGEVDKVKVADGLFFVLEKERRQLSWFDHDGKYKGHLVKRGRGRGEYLNISDFDVFDSYIYILSSIGQKIIKYDFDGNFIDEYNVSDWFSCIQVISETDVRLGNVSNTASGYNFAIFDTKKRRIVEKLDKFKTYSGYLMDGNDTFVGYNRGETLFSKPFDGRLYSLSDKGVKKLFDVHLSLDNNVDYDILDNGNLSDIADNCRFTDHFKYFSFVHIVDSVVFCVVNYTSHRIVNHDSFIKIDMSTNDIKTCKTGYVAEPDNKFPYICGGKIAGYTEDSIIFVLDVPWVKKASMKIADNRFVDIEENSNPFLFVYKLNFSR